MNERIIGSGKDGSLSTGTLLMEHGGGFFTGDNL
jgi:hypothetical protein